MVKTHERTKKYKKGSVRAANEKNRHLTDVFTASETFQANLKGFETIADLSAAHNVAAATIFGSKRLYMFFLIFIFSQENF